MTECMNFYIISRLYNIFVFIQIIFIFIKLLSIGNGDVELISKQDGVLIT